jgi:protein transport protein SEC23
MVDTNKEEINNGVRLSWNVFPGNKLDMARFVVPVGLHYNPMKRSENLQLLEYDPILCKTCKSVISPFCHIDFRAKSWDCPFCLTKHAFPSNYANFITESNLPAELIQEYTTIEYKLNKKETNFPTFLFLIDLSIDEEELQELKESIQNTLQNMPTDCQIGIITFGNMCNVVELGFTEFPKMYVFKGDKDYKTNEIQEQLGLISKHDPRTTSHSQTRKFILPLKDCEYTVSSFLDDLSGDLFPKGQGERRGNCSGLALHVAISLLESVAGGEPARILFFLGNACSIGPGQIVGLKLSETIRNYVDFEKKNTNTNYFKTAVDFYEKLATRASRAGIVIDVFSCSLNQVGLLEMKCLPEYTGGYMILTDFFSTMIFKDSLRKIFEVDEEGNLKMAFRGRVDMFVTQPIKIAGGIGYMLSLNQPFGTMVSTDNPIGQSGTRSWSLGGMDQNSTYTFVFDVDSNTSNNMNNARRCIIQILTTYVAGDRTTRLRVTTLLRKISTDFSSNKFEVAGSFDQEAAAVLFARMCVEKGYKEESIEVLRWLDKGLIRLITKFAEYNKDDVKSFRLSKEFSYFPQFIFYLRRSHFIQNFNASPDEISFYKTSLLHENVTNATIMIQPVLFSYTAENPEATPVFLEVDNMKNDWVLLLDAFFFICVWHGETVCKWRDAEYHMDPEYENIKFMLDNPQEYAQSIIQERMPVPRFVSCDYGTGQERLIKCVVNPGTSGSAQGSNVYTDGYASDDVSLKIFMDHLVKKAVQGN